MAKLFKAFCVEENFAFFIVRIVLIAIIPEAPHRFDWSPGIIDVYLRGTYETVFEMYVVERVHVLRELLANPNIFADSNIQVTHGQKHGKQALSTESSTAWETTVSVSMCF